MRCLVLCVALAGCANWTHADTAREVAFFAATTIDWQQTHVIVERCGELNPIMGPCGERVSVGTYFPLMLLAHVCLAAALPPSWRSTFQGVTIGMESATIVRNAQIE